MNWYLWWIGRSNLQIQRRQAATLAMNVAPSDLIALIERRRLAALENQIFGPSGMSIEQLLDFLNQSKNPAHHIERLLELCQEIQWDVRHDSHGVIEIELN